jgi:hypothetical protein
MSELGTTRGIPESLALRAPSMAGDSATGSPAAALAATQERQAAGDVVAQDPAAFAIAYSQYAAALGQLQTARLEQRTANLGLADELMQQHGLELATLVASLPTAMRAAFMSRLAVRPTQAGREKSSQEPENNAPAKAELAAAIVAGVAGTSEATLSLAAARLASYVARFGLDAATQLFLPANEAPGAHDRSPMLAPIALMPPAPTVDPRHKRREEEQRRRREPARNEEVEVADERPAGYTIDDIVQFSGETVAQRKTDPARLGRV